jgi:hypothetical protein
MNLICSLGTTICLANSNSFQVIYFYPRVFKRLFYHQPLVIFMNQVNKDYLLGLHP